MNIEQLLSGRLWTLSRPSGEIRSPIIELHPSGSIIGHSGRREIRWAILNEKLVFFDDQQKITAESVDLSSPSCDSVEYGSIAMCRPGAPDALLHLLARKYNSLIELLALSDERDIDSSVIRSSILLHPAFEGMDEVDSAAFTFPRFKDLKVIEVSDAELPRIAELGIRVIGDCGARNYLVFDGEMAPQNFVVRFNGNSFNVIVLDAKSKTRGSFNFVGNENVVVLGSACPYRDVNISVELRYGSCGLLVGSEGSAGQVNVWLEGPSRFVRIGDDFLFSVGIWLRTADSHGIIDLDLRKLVNLPRSIVIGKHVWLGQDVIVMPGSTVGNGSIIGARAIVTKAIPENCVAVGAPARVVRQRTSWTRSARPSASDIEKLPK